MQGTTEYLARKPSNEMLSTTISKVVWWLLFITNRFKSRELGANENLKGDNDNGRKKNV